MVICIQNNFLLMVILCKSDVTLDNVNNSYLLLSACWHLQSALFEQLNGGAIMHNDLCEQITNSQRY